MLSCPARKKKKCLFLAHLGFGLTSGLCINMSVHTQATHVAGSQMYTEMAFYKSKCCGRSECPSWSLPSRTHKLCPESLLRQSLATGPGHSGFQLQGTCPRTLSTHTYHKSTLKTVQLFISFNLLVGSPVTQACRTSNLPNLQSSRLHLLNARINSMSGLRCR